MNKFQTFFHKSRLNLNKDQIIGVRIIRGIFLTILFIIGNILFPLLLLRWLNGVLPKEAADFLDLFNADLIITNGIIICVIFSIWAFMKEKTLFRFILQVACCIVVIYMYFVGSSLFSLFLPHSNFATVYLIAMVNTFEVHFSYTPLALILIAIQLLYVMKTFLEFYKNI